MDRRKLDAHNTIRQYKILGPSDAFPELYDYAAYLCGGDFSLFDYPEEVLKEKKENDALLNAIRIKENEASDNYIFGKRISNNENY